MLERKTSKVHGREVAEREAESLRASVDTVLETDAGRRLFAHMYKWAGMNRSSLSRDISTGGIDLLTTAVNEANRTFYLHLAGLATRERLLLAEDLAHVQMKPLEEERKK